MLDLPPLVDRRAFLKLMSASLALAGSGCARAPTEKIVPYVNDPEGLVLGNPLYYATALTKAGYAHGVLVESNMGRPTKIEGNPLHPASLGSTGPIEQARILELWDPERSRTVLHSGQIAPWDEFTKLILDPGASWRANGGAGLRILTGALSSPTLLSQWEAFLDRYPNARLHHYEAVSRDHVYEGARLAFGRRLEPIYRFDRARIVLSLEADFLGSVPGHVRYARDFASLRRPEQRAMSRLYVAECMPSITGAAADHRLPWRSSEIERLGEEIAARLAEPSRAASSPWLSRALTDLAAHPGESLVLAGESQPPRVHALAHEINGRLGNLGRTIDCIAPVISTTESDHDSLTQLIEDMRAGRVGVLVILGGNPVYDAPVDVNFAQALAAVPVTVHSGLYVDETAQRCLWHVPAAHELESWSDACAFEGTITVQQPLIAPLYGGRSIHALLALLGGDVDANAHTLVSGHWRQQLGENAFAQQWEAALRSGVLDNTAARFEKLLAPQQISRTTSTSVQTSGLELVFHPDPILWDGRYAPNAWLQELPKPLTQLTWDNAAMMSPALAARVGVQNEDVVELVVNGHRLEAPVWLVPGHASEAITLHLGAGRTCAGPVGSHRGVSAYALRTSDAPWHSTDLQVRKLARKIPLATVQHHHAMHGRDIVRSAPLAAYLENPRFAQRDANRESPSLYPQYRYAGYAWGMSIDLSTCIGCNACTIACQAENNIPTVGKEEVIRGREMHWIRVDRYEEEDPVAPRTHFQPVPCMQCEHAPCELVCPVEASVHDAEGINVQVYNRCVGTRFCSNNCPYKVRRFNFLQYAMDDASLNAQRNPEVTVRMRGVMEKCNYCLQRVVRARITADRENRKLHDGEVLTACQAVCPTQAIVFGNLNDPASAVRASKASPRNYALLGELNTRPRTTYLAKVVNTAEDERSAAKS